MKESSLGDKKKKKLAKNDFNNQHTMEDFYYKRCVKIVCKF